MPHAYSSAFSSAFNIEQPGRHGSWEQLLGIIRSDRAERAADERTPPVACPIDGEPLETNSRGILHCPTGHFVDPSNLFT